LDEEIKERRAEQLMDAQRHIAAALNEEKVGTVCEAVVEGYDDYLKHYYGRTAADAPDIDGKIFFTSNKPLLMGYFAKIMVTNELEYDIMGEMI